MKYSDSGSRKDKAVQAIATIGPAVFNGGMTTFLALVMLGASTSHVFVTFFKVFVLTVLFGLFHGLVFFPTILSMLGPVNSIEESTCDSVGSTSTDISPASSGSSTPARSPQGHINRGLVLEVMAQLNLIPKHNACIFKAKTKETSSENQWVGPD